MQTAPALSDLWKSATELSNIAGIQQAEPGTAFGYDPQQAAFLASIFQPMNPVNSSIIKGAPNPLAGLPQQAMMSQQLADRRAKGAGLAAAAAMDQLNTENQYINSPLNIRAADPNVMRILPALKGMDVSNIGAMVPMILQGMQSVPPEMQPQYLEQARKFMENTQMVSPGIGKELLPSVAYGGGSAPQFEGVKAQPGVSYQTEIPKAQQMSNQATLNLPSSSAAYDGISKAATAINQLQGGSLSTSPTTAVLSNALSSVLGKDVASRIGTKADINAAQSVSANLQSAGMSPDEADRIARSVVIQAPDGTLTINNTALKGAVGTLQARANQDYMKNAAGTRMQDWINSVEGAKLNANANVQGADVIQNKIQNDMTSFYGGLAKSNGITADGKPATNPRDYLSSMVGIRDSAGNISLVPMSQFIQNIPNSADVNRSWSKEKQSVAEARKNGMLVPQGELLKMLSTPKGKELMAQFQIQNPEGDQATTPQQPPAKTSSNNAIGGVFNKLFGGQ